MDVRLRIAVASEGVNVAAFCRENKISRETFYVWRRRYLADGVEGLTARSRAPLSNPRRVDPRVEEEIVAIRKELADSGFDHGPATIQWHLGRRDPKRKVPSAATIWRVLVRRGFVVPEPRKRPKTAWRRFEATAPNELWQADTTDWGIATGVAKVLSFLDDHSRVALRVKALAAATSDATWDGFSEACQQWGVPLGQLTDNGLNFSGRLRGHEVRFEIELRAIGVVAKTSRPFHPQTCGKVERFQQTLKKWLRKQPLANDLGELQSQLDTFVAYYNYERPHRAANNKTPAQRWAATPPAINLGIALPSPARVTHVLISPHGLVKVGRYRVNVGQRWRAQTATVHADDTHIAVFINKRLVRALQIDPNTPYQGIRNRPNQHRPLT